MTSIKIQGEFFEGDRNWKADTKNDMEICKKCRIAKQFSKRTKIGGLTLLVFKTYYKTLVIKDFKEEINKSINKI